MGPPKVQLVGTFVHDKKSESSLQLSCRSPHKLIDALWCVIPRKTTSAIHMHASVSFLWWNHRPTQGT